eukprot:TRINITY_DN3495_c0_g2_i1.p2 TRINITY_DN3495_c0_g2~~TRINITY_DN3495_c0_g2_i1.p2  ORF type:complete len:191 (+),score=54.51 TRINITY_DN3495_c0_g2_i1:144-716(+)
MFGSVWDLLYLVGVGHATVRALNGMHDPLTTATTTPPTGALKGEWTEFIADSVHAAAHSTRPGSMLQKHVLPRCGVAPSGADGGAHPGVCPFSMWSEPAYFAGWGATPEPIVRATSSAFSVRSLVTRHLNMLNYYPVEGDPERPACPRPSRPLLLAAVAVGLLWEKVVVTGPVRDYLAARYNQPRIVLKL